jgi:hypothetical protein
MIVRMIFFFVAGMIMLMGAVFVSVLMVMPVGRAGMIMVVAMFMGVFVGMFMGVLVRVFRISVGMLVLMLMGMLVRVHMLVFVISFHFPSPFSNFFRRSFSMLKITA